ncbi:hypothetical protein PUN28_016819 [Cardiocondyla obscurior]|uniref:Uncharacterized protein n=1 Tax=Cardiocondyla obscurior TaxID=286306 RepID=A0AAW2ERA1_9HYME
MPCRLNSRDTSFVTPPPPPREAGALPREPRHARPRMMRKMPAEPEDRDRSVREPIAFHGGALSRCSISRGRILLGKYLSGVSGIVLIHYSIDFIYLQLKIRDDHLRRKVKRETI